MKLISSLFKLVSRYYFTLKYLRFKQIFYRIRYKLFPLKKLEGHPPFLGCQDWCWDGPEILEPSLLGKNLVCFLNHKSYINGPDDWNDPSKDKLWLYNLHYFDDLNAADNSGRYDFQLALVKRWINENPPVSGNGWEPYTISLRLVNWVKWYNRLGVDDAEIVRSITLQSEALTKQLEYHILGNHLFANAKALVFSGCFLKGSVADGYLELGLSILSREVQEQFLEDGGHFERSPMYHCILLWDLLDLINLSRISIGSIPSCFLSYWESVAVKALSWLAVMIHPDGEVSFFNDSAIGIAPSPNSIFEYANRLGLEFNRYSNSTIVTLKASGYSRINSGRCSIILDHADLGPDYLPGHGHADTLSFELSVAEQRVVVNSGTSVYGLSQERLRQRSTSAHSTVEAESENSSEVWGGFRVARRASGQLEDTKKSGPNGMLSIIASHDGYKRLNPGFIHYRNISCDNRKIVVKDQLSHSSAKGIAYFHLHPDVSVFKDSGTVKLELKDGTVIRCKSSSAVNIQPSSWHPKFGVSMETKKLAISLCGAELEVEFMVDEYENQ